MIARQTLPTVAIEGDSKLGVECDLYRRVIYQAYIDARGPDQLRQSSRGRMAPDTPQKQLVREEARAWFIHADEDFEAVCSAANVVPERLRRSVFAMLGFDDRVPA